MPSHPRSYSPAAAEKLRRALLALAAAAATATAADPARPAPRLAGAPPPPPRADGSAPGDSSSGSSRSLPAKEGYAVYVVKPGDTLSAIAQRHEVLQKSIVEANGLADPNRIRAGQQLYVPTQKDPSYTQRTGGRLVPTP